MATRKKSQQLKTGLLSGPSRKQLDVFTPRTGEYIKQPEKHNVITADDFGASGTGTVILTTVPSGKQLKLVYLALNYTAGAGSGSVGFTPSGGTYTFITYLLTTGTREIVWNYENAITMPSGSTLELRQFLGGGCNVTFSYILENTAEGYFTN